MSRVREREDSAATRRRRSKDENEDEMVAYLSLKSANDEIQGVRIDAFDTFLHDVVTVLILDTLQDVTVELFDDFNLLIARYRFQRFLNDAATVHLQRQR